MRRDRVCNGCHRVELCCCGRDRLWHNQDCDGSAARSGELDDIFPTVTTELTLGGVATLAGERSGESLEVTLLSYKPTITFGEYDTPDSGMKYVGVVLKIKNVGTVPYSDSPSNPDRAVGV